ncbi:family 43 glycosylhydrolase [Kibdelosporangium aridum]|uniref:Beta-xylosidase n=1 Tax=Kibdelosporangium aridum TaxID=2030 RepID=A0A1Y5Y8V2_KIBAR|nr:family 43 glycosylhydrolase [Kibdelosporangium aridum]SMD27304.1 Beta-xylosidase [Kibdelosporangium aridum]
MFPARSTTVWRRPLTAILGVLALTASFLDVTATPSAAATLDQGLVVRYDLTQSSGNAVTDTSGNGRNGTLSGDATWQGAEGLSLGGANGHVRLPNDIMRGLTGISVSVQVNVATDQGTPYFIWGLGHTLNGVGNGYLFTTGDQFRTSIATGNWSTEQTVASGRNLARGSWRTLTYTLAGGVAILYEDGIEVARKTDVTITPGAIGDGTTTANYLGRSVYTSDKYLKGLVRDFRIYDRAVTADEARALGERTAAGRAAADAAALDLGNTSAVTENLFLPVKGAGGSTISWSSSNPAVVSAKGVVTRPTPRAGNATVTLTATVSYAGHAATRTFTVTVLEDITDRQKVANALGDIVIWDQDAVRGNITLPTKGARDVTLTWYSNDPRVVSASGVVTRPPYGSKPRKAHLWVRASKGYASGGRDFTLTVLPLPKQEAHEGYMFAYFTGEATQDTEQVHFAASRGNDPLHWDELNGGRPVLRSQYGETGVRDPFIIRSPEGDKFYLIATDLQINDGRGWGQAQQHGSKYLEIWESTDLVTWSDQRHVRVSPDTAGMTWAPEATYDPTIGAYVVYWATSPYAVDDVDHTGPTYPRMMYSTTRDFRTFTEPEVWNDPGQGVIDSTVIKDGDYYYRLTTDEKVIGSCTRDIVLERSKDLRAVDLPTTKPRKWELVDDCIRTSLGTDWVEGPTVFKSNDGKKFYAFMDETPRRGYIPFVTDSLSNPNWQIPADYQLPARPRHGTVLPVTKAELARLRQGPPPMTANRNGVIADYDLTNGSGTTVADRSGNGRNAVLHGDVARSSDGLTFGGKDGYVHLPNNLMTGLNEITVSARVWVDPGQQTPYFLFNLGNSTNNAGNGYLFATGDAYRAAIASGDWSTERNASSGRNLARGTWHTLTYTLSGGTARLYDNGTEVARVDGVTTKPGDLGGGITTSNYIGRSAYGSDKYFKGKMGGFTVWNRGLTTSEILGLPGNETAVSSVRLDALKVPAVIDSQAGTIVLPVKPGTNLRRLAPQLEVADRAKVWPRNGSWQDFTKPVTYIVTGADRSKRTWTVRAAVMNSPVLPGFNADPNIVKFGDTYYIYATTDGFPGWSSTSFDAWSSKDLVHWTRHPGILDLGPGVSWADSRAWAPGIISKNGKYYFYFCADAKIGVAVADSPTGPFTDALGKPLIAANPTGGGQPIDPAVFTDDDGQNYLYWGNGEAYVVPLNADMISFDATKIKRITGLDGFREGLFMTKRAGTYHLTWSIDDTGSENYRVGYATATSPMLDGLTQRGVILEKNPSLGILGTGHHSIVQVPGTDDWYIAYHRFAIPGGDGTHREVTIDRLRFNADGTMAKVVPTLESITPLAK